MSHCARILLLMTHVFTSTIGDTSVVNLVNSKKAIRFIMYLLVIVFALYATMDEFEAPHRRQRLGEKPGQSRRQLRVDLSGWISMSPRWQLAAQA